MNIQILSNEERVSTGFTHKIILAYTDFTSEATTVAFEIFPKLTSSTPTFPAGTTVLACAARVSTAFVFAAGTLVFTLGDGGDTARYIASVTLKTAAWISGVQSKMPYVYNAADTIDIVATAGAGDLPTITAGELIIFLRLGYLDKMI